MAWLPSERKRTCVRFRSEERNELKEKRWRSPEQSDCSILPHFPAGHILHQPGRSQFLKVVPIVLVIFMLSNVRFAWANNLTISTISVSSRDASANTMVVQFNISWNNSWRLDSASTGDRDAVWVFIKYSTDAGASCNTAGATWNHATLLAAGTNPSGTSGGTGISLNVVVPTDKKGAFLERSAKGWGNVSNTAAKLVWDYGTDGLADSASVCFKVLGIEMTYIPTGSFYIGDGNGTSESANSFHIGTGNGTTQITTSLRSDIRVDTNSNDDTQIEGTGIGVDGDGGLDSDDNGSVDNASFPTGYNAFYAMKYEISQGQYKDFLNTLTRNQQKNRVAANIIADMVTNVYVMSDTSSVTNRQTINCPSSGNGTTNPISFSTTVSSVDKQDRAMNYLSWMDLAAYADWAALRPMTELEFEAMARGGAMPQPGEFVWGADPRKWLPNAASTISGTENGTETVVFKQKNKFPNVVYNQVTFTGGDAGSGPLRVGIFAAGQSGKTRAYTGAGLFGNMELAGNVWERVVTVGHSTGRAFLGTHGNGALTTTSGYEGNATNTDWPGIDGTAARGVTGAAGSGFRGGSWNSNTKIHLITSNRTNGALVDATRTNEYGARLVRTA